MGVGVDGRIHASIRDYGQWRVNDQWCEPDALAEMLRRPARYRRPGEPAIYSLFAAETSTQTTPLLPSWSAITVIAGALLSSMTDPPAARAAAIRGPADSGATYTSTWNR